MKPTSQEILRLKNNIYIALCKEDSQYLYQSEGGGFPELTVNRMITEAYEKGRSDATAVCYSTKRDIINRVKQILDDVELEDL